MKNRELLESNVNKTFEELLWCSKDEFRQWVTDLRKTVVYLWDEKGLPPKVGYEDTDIADAFRKMITYPVHEFETVDELTGETDVIRNTTNFSGYVNEWFPTMMKTKISYSTKKDAKSIYDYFADDSLYETFVTYASRHFKRDSFYHYSTPISNGDVLEIGPAPYEVTTPEAFRDWFEANVRGKYQYDYWLCPVKEDKVYTGFNQELKKKQNLFVTADFEVPEKCRTNINTEVTNRYSIRLFKLGQKVFPVGLKAFRVSFCQYAVNFPPLTARYLYEKYIDHIGTDETINIYDPSMGWAGRLIGAMSINDDYHIHYIGTDPNTDHNTTPGRTKYHEVADFFNDNVRKKNNLFGHHHTYKVFQLGSEVIGNDPDFQKYKGKIDLVFTSPPYFAKEVYSDDPEQSCHKFPQYDAWREEFLRPTLETAVAWLREDRYLLWNIADAAFDNVMLPLEQDSCDILESLGMVYKGKIKMALAQMPGGNRTEETGDTEIIETNTIFGTELEEKAIITGKMKNFCSIKSGKKNLMLKYEPVFVFYKPVTK